MSQTENEHSPDASFTENPAEAGAEALAEASALEARDPALTLKPGRLAGSAQCLNCGTPLAGPFCHYCGQPDRNFMRFFPALLREFMEEFLDLDSRFMRTMKPLLFKPGRLTRDYLDGRRFRYTPPLRLYIFASIGFFLLAATLSTNAIDVGMNVDPVTGESNINISTYGANQPLDETQQEEVRAALERAGIEDAGEMVERMSAAPPVGEGKDSELDTFTADQITVNDKPWDKETNPLEIPFMPAFVNRWINNEIEQSPAKARRINENPNVIVDQIFDILPATMFVLLPVVALLFKFWYAFAKRYYIEHLIYALHNHSFIFVCAIMILLFNLLRIWADTGWLADTMVWAINLTAIWIPVYLLISLRRVYQQGWFLTTAKFSLIGLSYVTLLAFVTSVVAILGFVLL